MSPLPDVSSTIASGGSPALRFAPGDLACASDASAAIAQSSVSSGEKKEVNLKGGRNGRSRPASPSSEGRIDVDAAGLPYRYGTVYPLYSQN